MNRSIDFFLVAGEASGDLHGSNLLKALKENCPQATFCGVGGPLMRQEGLYALLRMEDFEIMGFLEVLIHFRRLWKQFHYIRDEIIRQQPKALILIDYPGFNLRLAKNLRNKGYQGKIIQYISPTVWAWGKKRIQQMEKTLDLLLTILPFESTYFDDTRLSHQYVGHPILEAISQHVYQGDWKQSPANSQEHLIALFPGSRKKEVENHLPHMLKAAAKLKANNPNIHFAISYARADYLPIIQEMVKESQLEINKDVSLVASSFNYELMRACRSAIAKSGTVTLELALHHKPSVVVYVVSAFNYFFAKYCLRLKLPHFCLVNILAKQEVFPELITKELQAEDIFLQIQKLDFNGPERDACLQKCREIEAVLGQKKASCEATKVILELV